MACSPLSEFQFTLGWVLLASTVLLAYAPQWIKQCRLRSHIGMSLSNYLCATLVSLLQLLNYMCCKYADTFCCCQGAHTPRQCLAALQPVIQTALALLCYVVVVALYFIHFDRRGLAALGRSVEEELGRARRRLVLAAGSALLLLAAPAAIALASDGVRSRATHAYGVAAEVAASLMLATHWSLQMWETWEVRSIGSLSLFGLMIGCIGNLLNAYSLGVHGGVVVGTSNFVAALMIGATCTLGCYVERCKQQDRKALQERLAATLGGSGATRGGSGT